MSKAIAQMKEIQAIHSLSSSWMKNLTKLRCFLPVDLRGETEEKKAKGNWVRHKSGKSSYTSSMRTIKRS